MTKESSVVDKNFLPGSEQVALNDEAIAGGAIAEEEKQLDDTAAATRKKILVHYRGLTQQFLSFSKLQFL